MVLDEGARGRTASLVAAVISETSQQEAGLRKIRVKVVVSLCPTWSLFPLMILEGFIFILKVGGPTVDFNSSEVYVLMTSACQVKPAAQQHIGWMKTSLPLPFIRN